MPELTSTVPTDTVDDMITMQGFNGGTLLILLVLVGFAVFGRKVIP